MYAFLNMSSDPSSSSIILNSGSVNYNDKVLNCNLANERTTILGFIVKKNESLLSL